MKLFYCLLLCILLSGLLYAQIEDTSTHKDTVFRYQGINPVLNINQGLYDFTLPFDISTLQSNQLPEGASSTLWLCTGIALSYSSTANSDGSEIPEHLMLPFYQHYLENSKINPLTYVLGLAQTAAVGYMAYRHIKKYGFWK